MFALFWMLAMGWRGWDVESSPKSNSPHPTDNQWARYLFYMGGEGLHEETAQSALTIILKLIGHQISIISIAFSAVYLQFQDWMVPISLRPILRTVAVVVMATVWSSCP